MTEIYLHIVIMSFVASIVIITLKLTSKITLKFFPASWHYYSYLLLFTLFAIPFYFWLPWDVTMVASSLALHVEHTASAMAMNAAPYALFTGTVIYAGLHLFRYQKLSYKIRRSCVTSSNEQHFQALTWSKRQLRINKNIIVYISPYMTTPFIYGLWKPKIVLPSISFTQEELRHIFLHELTHYKRGDLWVKILLMLIHSLHWFNPITYIARREIDRYGEYTCDEKITKGMETPERKRYCELLLKVMWNVIDQKSGHYTAMSQERQNIERRMATILQSKTKKKVELLFGVTLTIFLATFGTMVGFTANANIALSPINSHIHNVEIGEELPVLKEVPSVSLLDASEVPSTSYGND